MTTTAPDFSLLFSQTNVPMMALDAGDFTIVAATTGYLAATMRRGDDIIGRQLFDSFPAAPGEDPEQGGTQRLRQSLEWVCQHRQAHQMDVTRYPIEQPASAGGGFVERYWEVTNTPIFAADGTLQYIIHAVEDVTLRVRAEQQSEQADFLARPAGQFAKLGWWRFQLDPPLLFWSDETAKIHDELPGFVPSVTQAIEFYKPEYRELISSELQRCIEQGKSFDVVTELVTKRQRHIWIRSIGEAEYDSKGRIIAVHGAFQDISDLVQARNQAETIGTQLRQTLENISDAFYMLDHHWRFVFVNSQAERLLQTNAKALGLVDVSRLNFVRSGGVAGLWHQPGQWLAFIFKPVPYPQNNNGVAM